MFLTTTLNDIRKHHPCSSGWETLLKTLGKTKSDAEAVSFKTILESNDLDDALWCLRSVEGHDTEIRAFSRWCALQVVHLWACPSIVLQYLQTGDETLRAAARDAAWDAARAAAWDAARAAARAAAWDAARAAARDATWAAAWAAARDATWDAARDASWDAARAAAWDAARDAARAAAWDATRAAQRNQFEMMFCTEEN